MPVLGRSNAGHGLAFEPANTLENAEPGVAEDGHTPLSRYDATNGILGFDSVGGIPRLSFGHQSAMNGFVPAAVRNTDLSSQSDGPFPAVGFIPRTNDKNRPSSRRVA